MEGEDRIKRWCGSARRILGTITIEPLFFLLAMGFSMIDVTRQDFLYVVNAIFLLSMCMWL